MRPARDSRRWRLAVFATTGGLLVAGFGASALANRLAFAGWGLAAALAAVPVLRRGFEATAPGEGLLLPVSGRLLLYLAAAAGLFAMLVARYESALDTGLRAVTPALYRPALAEAGTYMALAALLAGAGSAAGLLARMTRRRWPAQPPGAMPAGRA